MCSGGSGGSAQQAGQVGKQQRSSRTSGIDCADAQRVECTSERDVFAVLGLRYREPSLRNAIELLPNDGTD